MLTEDEPEVREDAVKTVLSIRKGGDGLRKATWLFLPPDINLRVTSLRELIMWDTVKLLEPLLTRNAADSGLMEMRDVPYRALPYPNHNQAV